MKFSTRSTASSLTRSLAVVCLSARIAAAGTSDTYIGPDNGTWTTAANWSPGNVPNVTDDVLLGSHYAGTTDLHVTFNGSYTTNALNSLTLNSSGLAGYMIFNQTVASSTMSALTENVGNTTADNTYNQSAGTNDTFQLNVGVSSANNFYNLSGTGYLDTSGESIGVSGTGIFNQTGGTNLTNTGYNVYPLSILTLGVNSGGNGTYNLSSGTLTADGEQIGSAGTGTFNQTGGTNNVGSLGTLTVGGGTAGGHGYYNFSGGTLTGSVLVQNNGTFNLNSGAILQNASVEVGSGGLLNLGGGTFGSSPAIKIDAGGVFQVNGYSPTVGLMNLAGTLTNNASGNATVTVSGNLLQTAGAIQNGVGPLTLALPNNVASTFGGTNTYSGTTAISGGTVTALSAGAFSPNSAYTFTNVALDVNGQSATMGSLAGTGGSLALSNIGLLTVGGNNQSTSYNGPLSGNGVLVKVGTGTLTLSGGGTNTGGINLMAGALTINATNGLSTGSFLSVTGNSTFNLNASQSLGYFAGSPTAVVNFNNNPTLSVETSNLDTYFSSNSTGSAVLVKLGTGNLNIGIGTADTSGNTNTALTVDANAGLLTLIKAPGVNAIGGPLNINGGTVVLAASEQIADASVVTLTSGALNLAGFSETIGGLTGTGGTVNPGGGTLNVAQASSTSWGGSLTGTGSFAKAGAGTLTLTGVGGYGGTFTVNGGTLTLQGSLNATGFTANAGGTLLFNNASAGLDAGTLLANSGGTVQYSGATIGNGYLRGAGTHAILAGATSTFNGITTYNSTTIAQNGPANFNNFTNGGTLNNGAALNFSGGVNASTGTINVSSTLNTQDFGTNGVMTINNGGTVNNSGSNFVAGGGSRTTINSGGTLATTNGTSIELNGALLTNNGTQNGLLDVNYGSSARGSGVFGTVNVTTGGKFGNNTINNGLELQVGGSLRLAPAVSVSPGPFVGPQLSTTPTTITVGGMLLGAGSNLGINVQNAQGTAGTGYDTFHDLGALTLNGASTPGNQIVISLASLNASGNPGLALNFDPTRSSAFTLVTADGGITGYNAGEFAVDTSGFSNALDGGNFSVAENGNLLQLDFIPSGVPEPSTWIFAAMVSTAGVARWARKRRVTPV